MEVLHRACGDQSPSHSFFGSNCQVSVDSKTKSSGISLLLPILPAAEVLSLHCISVPPLPFQSQRFSLGSQPQTPESESAF